MQYVEEDNKEKKYVIGQITRMLVESEQFKKDATKFLESNYNDINLDDDEECAEVLGIAIFDGYLSDFADYSSIPKDELESFVIENFDDVKIAFPEYIGLSNIEIGQKIVEYIIKERKWEVEFEVEANFYPYV